MMVETEISDVVSTCRQDGYAKVELTGEQATDLAWLEELLRALGEPIHVFRNHPFWKPLAVDLARPTGRSGGAGLNSLHSDCVNAEFPPDFLCLYCVRPDPLGGGRTVLSVLDGVEQEISAGALATLEKPEFRDGAVYDLDHVGVDCNPFPVYAQDGWRWRYTGRLLETGAVAADSEQYAALLEFDRIVMSRSTSLKLEAGQAVVLDQRRVLHGRLPLAPGQDAVPLPERRLLVQAYAKDGNAAA